MTKEDIQKHREALEKLEREAKENQYFSKAYMLFKVFLLVLISPLIAKRYKISLKDTLQWIKTFYLNFVCHKEKEIANKHEIKHLRLKLKLFEAKNDNS